MNSISENILRIKQRIKSASERAGRDPGEVKLLAVSKTYSPLDINNAYESGQKIFGESRVQEALKKIEELNNPDIEFHLIGNLQLNKVKYLQNKFSLVHSVDSIELIKEMEKRFYQINHVQDILIQINIAREHQKHGVFMENFNSLLEYALKSDHVKVRGLMMIPPFTNTPEENRIYFREMKKIYDKIFQNRSEMILSMGMSDDFEIAVEEGSNMVRIGTAIFGKRG